MSIVHRLRHGLRIIRGRVFRRLGLTDKTVIKVYHGYGHASQLVLYGHVFRQSALPRKRYRQSVLNNTWALLRLFMVKPLPNVRLRTQWQGQVLETVADRDGFYKFEWQDIPPLEQGWHELTVEMLGPEREVLHAGSGSLYIPHATQYGFISDVDDTFLISHSANLRKRLFVLFTQNARSRRPFEGVVKHYQLLAAGNTSPDAPNPFFYVSSSEWNLYEYLLEFTRVQSLPRGVFLLNVMKQVRELLNTGQSNHQGKFARIVRIIEGFPKQRFVLLGDSSQRDPYIYESIVRHFPGRIHAVYIRDVYRKSRVDVLEVVGKIEAAGVPVCFFRHSEEAILHSRKIGLISDAAAARELSAGDPDAAKGQVG
ncbi:MAG: DUF2183 domain-containing protein [Chitinophagaceae bacterium]|nr:MAG: DUF2183 domain-containing protein [Chitinophagaceae bacterium]